MSAPQDTGAGSLSLRRFIPELDGLRCYAFLLVLVAHLHLDRFGEFPLGWVGVDIFFVLSGFLITRILLESRGSPGYFRNFYARRFLRVFPLYYGTLIFVFYVWPHLTDDPRAVVPAAQHPYFFLYVHNLFLRLLEWAPTGGWAHYPYLGHFWSLAIEEQYYLVWPFLVLWLRPRALRRVLVFILVASPVLRFYLYRDDPHHALPQSYYWFWSRVDPTFLGRTNWWIYKNTLTRLDGIALGSLVALVVNQGWLTRAAFRRLAAVLAVVFLPLSTWLIFRHDFFPITQYPPRWLVTSIYPMVALGFAGLIGVLMTHTGGGPLTWLFDNPPVRYVGKISYGLYVFHWPTWIALNETFGLHSPWLFAGLTFAAAMLSWHLFERPILRLKSRFEYREPVPGRAD